MRWLPFFLALALFAGCDSGNSDSPASLEVATPLEDLALPVGERREVDLTEHFRHSKGAALAFEARRDSGRSVEVVAIEDGQMQLEAQSEGRSIISVRAASRFLETSADFAVDVTPGICPPEPGPGMADYFPMETGQVWLFDYRYRNGTTDSDSGENQREGQVSMEFESVACANYVRTAQVREVTTIDGNVHRDIMRTFTEDSTNTLRLELPGGYVYYDTDPYEAYPIPRYAPASGRDTLEYGRLWTQRERGIAAWVWGAYGPIFYEEVRIDRVD
jgi:hypothetical protein